MAQCMVHQGNKSFLGMIHLNIELYLLKLLDFLYRGDTVCMSYFHMYSKNCFDTCLLGNRSIVLNQNTYLLGNLRLYNHSNILILFHFYNLLDMKWHKRILYNNDCLGIVHKHNFANMFLLDNW